MCERVHVCGVCMCVGVYVCRCTCVCVKVYVCGACMCVDVYVYLCEGRVFQQLAGILGEESVCGHRVYSVCSPLLQALGSCYHCTHLVDDVIL